MTATLKKQHQETSTTTIDLEQFKEELSLGDSEMDNTHKEFLVLADHVTCASRDELARALHQLFIHTKEHFDAEEKRMLKINHNLYKEHRSEHQRVLGDMERFYQRAEKGRGAMAKAWVSDNLLDWFQNHARTMDSALAAELKNDQE